MNRRELLQALPAAAAALPGALAARPAGSRARLRTALVAYSFREALGKKRMSYEDLVHRAVEWDIDGLDLTVYWLPSTSEEYLAPLRRLAYRNAVEIYSISIRTEMCRPTPELRAREVEEVRKWADVAEKLGASHIRVFGGNVPKGSSEEEAAGWVTEVLKRAAEYSGKKGVILGLENHGGITLRAERIIQIVKAVDSPWVGINLDTGNFREDPYAQIEMCLPYAVNTQFKAEIRGEGGSRQSSDWDRIVAMLAKSGYRGYLGLEYEAKEDPMTAVPRLMKQLRELAKKYS
jgi:sugar phosphate isomerase/epimerase